MLLHFVKHTEKFVNARYLVLCIKKKPQHFFKCELIMYIFYLLLKPKTTKLLLENSVIDDAESYD